MNPPPTRRALAAATVAMWALVGCAIRPDAAPVEIKRVNPSAERAEADATGRYRVYFVGPGERRLLRSVARQATSRTNLMELLLQGPNDAELQQNYFTAIPTTSINSVRTIGTVLIVDIGNEITQLTGSALTRALAQIVFTATDLDGIEKVQILVDGKQVDWPTAVGTANRSGLQVYDFPGLVESSQPDYPVQP